MTHYAFHVGFLLLIYIVSILCNQVGLYDDREVKILDASNFKDVVCNSASAWVVQFHNRWCGHCIRFAPTYKVFARDVAEWHKVVQVGVVDCAEKENTALCREYNIQSVPTIKLFGPHASETDAGEEYSDARDVGALRHRIVSLIDSLTTDKVPDNWPSLKFVTSTESLKSSPARVVALVVEDDSSFIGREVILDLSSQPDVSVSRISPQSFGLSDTSQLPALYTLDKSSHQFVQKLSNIQNRTTATSMLQDMVGYIPKKVSLGNGVQPVVTTIRPATRPQTKVYMKDLESGVLYSLSREVAGMKHITGDKLDALKRYTVVLAKYFPGNHKMMQSLNEIKDWTAKKASLNGEEFENMIKRVQERNPSFPTVSEWVGCKGSAERYRGYPCSVWMMFHALTVNSALEHGQDPSFDSDEVLVAMREYIRHYFGCRECSEHFTDAAKNLESEVSTADDSIMWLWRSHNRANFFLKGDSTEDPAHPKIQFPSSKDCPMCHAGDGFNETQVLVFMKSLYGRRSIVLEETDTNSSSFRSAPYPTSLVLVAVLCILLRQPVRVP